jgi:hypothetical protein
MAGGGGWITRHNLYLTLLSVSSEDLASMAYDPDPATPEELASRLLVIFNRVKTKREKDRRRINPELVAKRVVFQPGNDAWRNTPRCASCSRWALKGTKACSRHGSGRALAARETGDTPRYLSRMILRWMRRGILPAELTTHPLWQRCIIGARLHHEALVAMAIGWTRKTTSGDVAAWIEAQEKARQSLASHGHPIPDR